MRYARRVDSNEAEIVLALRKCGASVEHILSDNVPGIPDLLVGIDGRNLLVEVKMPLTGRLSGEQTAWRNDWKGQRPFVLKDAADVVAFIGLVKGKK